MKDKWFPLPPDYPELSSAGQRMARLAAISDQSTPEKLVQAWDLFRRLYLHPQGEAFYKGGFVESPRFHYQAIEDLGRYARNALAAPRGSAKSTIVGCEIPLLLLLTRPYYSVALCLATDSLVRSRFDTITVQLTENPLIIEDFGEQRPPRGQAPWEQHYARMKNGSILQGFSVMGKKRGARPRLFILDDPENDPDSQSETSKELLLEKFEQILFKQIIPMLEYGSAIFWIGTLINRRCFLYRALCMEDQRFTFWNRRVLHSIEYDVSQPSYAKVLWPEKWPLKLLEVRRAEIGDSAFSSEYQNDPTSDASRTLIIDPKRNEYTVESIAGGGDYLFDPLRSSATLIWHERERDSENFIELKKPFGEFAKSLFRIMTVDYATGFTQYHDYSCIAVVGYDIHNTMWVLDMWMGRVKESVLRQKIYQLGQRWMVKAIGIEAVSVQVWFADIVGEDIQHLPGAWRPRVIPVKYPGNVPKPDRIAGLEPRFHQGLIKYPSHLADTWPFNMLYSQTRDFTYDLALLPFDDAIDSIAMCQYVVHARGVRGPDQGNKQESRLARLKRGKPTAKGLPILEGGELPTLTPEELGVLIDRYYKKAYSNKMKGKYNAQRPTVIAG